MAARVDRVQEWLNQFPPNWEIGIDDGGLELVVTAPARQITATYELGGMPEENQEDTDGT
jgi:hypothetical protein